MDCSLPDFSVHGITPGKNSGVGYHFLLQGVFLTQGSNPQLLNIQRWQVDSLPLMPPGGDMTKSRETAAPASHEISTHFLACFKHRLCGDKLKPLENPFKLGTL